MQGSLRGDRNRRTWRSGLLALGLGLVLTSGCSDDGGGDALSDPASTPTSTSTSTSTSTTSTSTTSTTVEPEAELIGRYQSFWEARFQANQSPPDPDDPALADFATGEQLSNVVAETRSNLESGLAFRRPTDQARRSQVNVVSLEGDTATLQDCYVNDGIVYRPATGEIVNDGVATHSVRGTMQRLEGVWKLARTELVQRWEGVAGCALANDF